MKAIDLFAGVGGFHIGLSRAGIDVVYANEWDKYASQCYKKHFGFCDSRDITTVRAEELPPHDIICGGFPCQAFSVAGKRRGFDETRGTLFFEIMRLARANRTPYLLLENVKGLLNHDRSRTFETIIRTLGDLGYGYQWQVCNSKDFGVPQNRERVFIVANLRDRPRPEVFPIGGNDEMAGKTREKTGTKAQVSNALRAKGGGGRGDVEDSYVAHTLTSSEGGPDANGTYVEVPEPTKKGYAVAKEGDSINLAVPTSKTRRKRVGKGVAQTLDTGAQQAVVQRVPLKFLQRNQKNVEGDYAFTVDTGQTGGVRVGTAVRRLTPLENERLQGFPDNWTKYAERDDGTIYEQSDTQRYKQMGNAVTVNVVEAIARRIVETI